MPGREQGSGQTADATRDSSDLRSEPSARIDLKYFAVVQSYFVLPDGRVVKSGARSAGGLVLLLPLRGPGLPHGIRVWGRVFLRRESNAVLVPVGALVRDAGGWAVFVVANSRATSTPVRIGAIGDADAEVIGLPVGARVVICPSDQVRDGVLIGEAK